MSGIIDNTKSKQQETRRKEAYLKTLERNPLLDPDFNSKFRPPTKEEKEYMAKSDKYGNLLEDYKECEHPSYKITVVYTKGKKVEKCKCGKVLTEDGREEQ